MKYAHPVTIIVECKNAESGRWGEFDFFDVPNGLVGKYMRLEMNDKFNASYSKYRTDKKSGIKYYYFESDVETLRCYESEMDGIKIRHV